MMEKLQIDSKFADQSGEIMLVELGGHVDQSNSYQLERLFDNIIESGCYRVIVDFSKVYYMSSAGWGVFVGEIKRFRDRGGDIKLANMNPDIYEVYQMLEFYHILEDYPSIEAAAASFKKDEEEIDMVIEEIEQDETEVAQPEPVEEMEETVEEIDLEEIVADETEEKPDGKEKKDKTEKPSPLTSTEFGKEATHEFIPTSLQSDVKLADLPLPEKVKRVIAQNPLVGIWGIKKILKHPHFGKAKVSIFRLYKILRELDLDTKAKRYRFYRSC